MNTNQRITLDRRRLHTKVRTFYYNLHPNFWGQGFGSEALKAIVCYGFEALNLHRIEAGVAVENAKSVRKIFESTFDLIITLKFVIILYA